MTLTTSRYLSWGRRAQLILLLCHKLCERNRLHVWVVLQQLELWLLHSLSIMFVKFIGLCRPLIHYSLKLVWRVTLANMVNDEVIGDRPILRIWFLVRVEIMRHRKVLSYQIILLLGRQSLLWGWEVCVGLWSFILFRNLEMQLSFFVFRSNNIPRIFPNSLILVKKSRDFVSWGQSRRLLIRRMEYALEVGLAIAVIIIGVNLLWILFKSLGWSRRHFLAHVSLLSICFILDALWGIVNIRVINCQKMLIELHVTLA